MIPPFFLYGTYANKHHNTNAETAEPKGVKNVKTAGYNAQLTVQNRPRYAAVVSTRLQQQRTEIKRNQAAAQHHWQSTGAQKQFVELRRRPGAYYVPNRDPGPYGHQSRECRILHDSIGNKRHASLGAQAYRLPGLPRQSSIAFYSKSPYFDGVYDGSILAGKTPAGVFSTAQASPTAQILQAPVSSTCTSNLAGPSIMIPTTPFSAPVVSVPLLTPVAPAPTLIPIAPAPTPTPTPCLITSVAAPTFIASLPAQPPVALTPAPARPPVALAPPTPTDDKALAHGGKRTRDGAVASPKPAATSSPQPATAVLPQPAAIVVPSTDTPTAPVVSAPAAGSIFVGKSFDFTGPVVTPSPSQPRGSTAGSSSTPLVNASTAPVASSHASAGVTAPASVSTFPQSSTPVATTTTQASGQQRPIRPSVLRNRGAPKTLDQALQHVLPDPLNAQGGLGDRKPANPVLKTNSLEEVIGYANQLVNKVPVVLKQMHLVDLAFCRE